MWARHFELSLGLWLALSPFVFRHGPEDEVLWWMDLSCAFAITFLAVLPHWRPARYAHLAELPIAALLVAHGWWSALEAATPAAQNHILVGLLLGMFAIVPSDATRPPVPWREVLADDRPE